MTKRKKYHCQPCSKINVVDYTDFSAEKSFPEDSGGQTKEFETAFDGQFEARLNKALEYYFPDYSEENIPDANPTLKFGVIDEEYYEWLGDKSDTSAKRLAYVDGLTEQEATRLMNKHGKGWSTGMYVFPLTVIFQHAVKSSTTRFQLKPIQISRLTSFFESNFPESEVLIPGCVLDPVSVGNFAEDIEYDCRMTMCHGERMDFSKYMKQQDMNGTNVSRLYVPLMIGHCAKSAFVKAEKIFYINDSKRPDDFPEYVIFDKNVDLQDDSIYAKSSFNDIGMDNLLMESFRDALVVCADPYLLNMKAGEIADDLDNLMNYILQMNTQYDEDEEDAVVDITHSKRFS